MTTRGIFSTTVAAFLIASAAQPALAQERSQQSAKIDYHEEGFPVVQLYMDGARGDFMLDTGADGIILSPQFVSQNFETRSSPSEWPEHDFFGYLSLTIRVSEEGQPIFKSERQRVQVSAASESLSLDGFVPPQVLAKESCVFVDFPREELRFLAKQSCSSVASGEGAKGMLTHIPSELGGGHYLVSAEMPTGRDKSLLLDTGGPFTYLPAGSLPQHMQSEKMGTISDMNGRKSVLLRAEDPTQFGVGQPIHLLSTSIWSPESLSNPFAGVIGIDALRESEILFFPDDRSAMIIFRPESDAK